MAVTIHAPAEDKALIDSVNFAELCIVSSVDVLVADGAPRVEAAASDAARCARCWRHLPDVAAETDLCGRCDEVVAEMDE